MMARNQMLVITGPEIEWPFDYQTGNQMVGSHFVKAI
jgi:hypothetical protein